MPPHVPSDVPSVRVDCIAKHDNWDARECAVANALEWRQRVLDFIDSHGGRAQIPKHIHQIWIGTREPPCVWLDTWRCDFLAEHGVGWEYTLWDNDKVAALREEKELVNGDLFDREHMWQCKADLLRLELLYRFGGVYIDADLVSLNKPLDHVLEQARETGFGVSYEADTKDKPYSVLGNSIIFASKRHPLLELLIHYIRAIYKHKRPYFGVEWVTGPLAFTKALMHSNLPLTMIPRQYFYPTFHYIPNPDAIDPDAFPEALGFQFGYTCSNLGEWVKRNNRCKRALDCSYCKTRTDYAFGPIKSFPNEVECVEDGEIPKIIHQFVFTDRVPTRWIDSWAQNFCSDNPGWLHRVWRFDDLKSDGAYFCSHRYSAPSRRMDDEAVRLLALEVLYKHGGYYVPLTSLYDKDLCNASGEGVFPPKTKKGMATRGGIIGSVKNGLTCLKLIKSTYALGRMPKVVGAAKRVSDVTEMGVSDAVAGYLNYPTGSRFLGAERLVYSTAGRNGTSTLPTAVVFAYDAQVPIYPCGSSELMTELTRSNSSVVVLTDADAIRLPRITDGVAGLLYRVQQQDADWDYLTLGLEWNAGVDEETIGRLYTPVLAENVHCFGVVVNTGRTAALDVSRADPIGAVLERHNDAKVYAGTVRFAHNESLSAVYSAMPLVGDVMWRIAGHGIPGWECDHQEVHGRLLKGMRGGQLAYELIVDDNSNIMYRAFNENGGMNCEARITQGIGGRHMVQNARVYYDHTIVFEGNNIAL